MTIVVRGLAVLALIAGSQGCFLVDYRGLASSDGGSLEDLDADLGLDAARADADDADPKPDTSVVEPLDASVADAHDMAAEAAVMPNDASDSSDAEAPWTYADGGSTDAGSGDAAMSDASSLDAGDAGARPRGLDAGYDAATSTPVLCVGQATCAPACGHGGSCGLGCAGAGACAPTCGSGAECLIECTDTQSCAAVCEHGSKCAIRCNNSDCSNARCESGASCLLLECSNGASCP